MTRLKRLFEAYGPVALVVWLVLFGLTWATLAVAFAQGLRLGFDEATFAGSAGAISAAYAATYVTKPLRALATLVITPVVAKAIGRKPKAGDSEAR